MRRFRFHDGRLGAAITVHVTPRARKNELTGIYPDGTLRVRLTALPVEGAANKALLELLAHVLTVRAGDMEIIAGEKSKDKIVSVVGLNPQTVEDRLKKYIKENEAEDK
jgi:uncharacterized protein